MRSIVYHVATSIDGFIAGPGNTPAETIQDFLHTGPHVDDYNQQLQEYDIVLMGRRTYEFGFAFGLYPGQTPYPHMDNYVFSRSLPEPNQCDPRLFLIRNSSDDTDDGLDRIRDLRESPGADIYLCGGGAFAGSLLQAGLIDRIRLKINPVILGAGIPLFGGLPMLSKAKTDSQTANQTARFPGLLELESYKTYENGVLLQSYRMNHEK